MMVTNSAALKSSAIYVGYQILKEIQNQGKNQISLYDISAALKKQGISGGRQLLMGLSFLYSVGLIDFEEAMIWVKKSNESV